MNPVKYSVLIPCYKTDPLLLSHCLKSILSTSRTDIEIILVEALHEGKSSYTETGISDARIRFFVSDKASAPHQRNTTLQKALGDYLIFVDSDDCISPSFFEFADQALNALPSSDLWIFNHTSDSSFYDGPFAKSDFITSSDRNEMERWFSCVKHEGPHFQGRALWAKIFRHSIIEEHKMVFDLTLPSAQDIFFVMEYLSYCKTISIAEKYRLYHFDISPSSMTPKASTNSPERFTLILDAWNRYFAKFPPSQIRKSDWAYNVVGFYIPRMMSQYFCSSQETRTKKELQALFVKTLKTSVFRKPITACRFRYCLNGKKRFQLFLLKLHCYRFYFNFFWKLYKAA
jgi:glycosyltransferase involved in cell wall biosynthesis